MHMSMSYLGCPSFFFLQESWKDAYESVDIAHGSEKGYVDVETRPERSIEACEDEKCKVLLCEHAAGPAEHGGNGDCCCCVGHGGSGGGGGG